MELKDESGRMKDETERAYNGKVSWCAPATQVKKESSDASHSSFILHPSSFQDASSLRILLWDIDGTLIRSVRAGAFKDYTVPMLEEVFGTAGCLPQMKVSGMTDLQIVGEALKCEGFTHEDIRERIEHLRDSYMQAIHRATGK